MTGERYEAGRVHGLSEVGRPLLVRYDLDALASAVSKDDIAASDAPGFWRYAPFLPVTKQENRVSLGEVVTPLIPLEHSAPGLGAKPGKAIVKDEGRLPTGSFKARGLCLAVSMAKEFGLEHIAIPTNGNAGAALAAYARRAGQRATVFCPADTPDINVREIQQQGAGGLEGQWPDQRLRTHCRRGQGSGRLVRRLDVEGALPYRRQEDHGSGAGRTDGLAPARCDLLSDRWRHRFDRHVEGLPRIEDNGMDRWAAAAHDRGAGRGLRAHRAGPGKPARSTHRCGRMPTPSPPVFGCRSPLATS